MITDPDYIKKRIAYVDAVHSIHPNKKTAGMIGCLLGVLLLAWSRFRDGAPHWTLWAGLIVIAAGWLLFAYVLLARTRYVRTHPFDSES
jgi:hypothetical protein